MARPLRIEFPGAIYHITSRGNAREPIFLDIKDRRKFLHIFSNVVKKYHWECYAYCLMTNHYHLVIRTLDANLAQGMRDLNGIYTQAFQENHDRIGHIFQGRYKAFLVEEYEYLLTVARYTVLNPVRAQCVLRPEQWLWSSYQATLGTKKAPSFLTIDGVLKWFSRDRLLAQRKYLHFVTDDMSIPSPFKDIQRDGALGSLQFLRYASSLSEKAFIDKEYPRSERYLSRHTLEDLFDEIKTVEDRNTAICIAQAKCGYLITEIADFLELDRSTIGKILKKYQK